MPPRTAVQTQARWTLRHKAGYTLSVLPGTSMRLAYGSGYVAVNRGNGVWVPLEGGNVPW